MIDQQYDNHKTLNDSQLPSQISIQNQSQQSIIHTPSNTIDLILFKTDSDVENEMKNQEQQGFQYRNNDAEYVIQVQDQLRMSTISMKAMMGSSSQKRTILKNPLCIYPKIDLYIYPQQIDQISKQFDKQAQQSQLQVELQPQQWLLYNSAININNLNNQNLSINENALDRIKKYKQFISNKQVQCIYNRHGENLANKHDMTIFLKSIKLVLQNDMIREFYKDIRNLTTPKDQIQIQGQLVQMLEAVGRGQMEKFKKNNKGNNIKYYNSISKQYIVNKNRLEFYSNFECGNLHSVFKYKTNFQNNINNSSQIGRQTYYLFIQNDINTHGYNQWFNFIVKYLHTKQPIQNNGIETKNKNMKNQHNVSKKQKYTANFVIINISKDIKSNQNMKILAYSFNTNKWQYKIPYLYYKNKYLRHNGMNYMTVQFQYQFENSVNGMEKQKDKENMVQFCLTFPYSYSKLIKFLRDIRIHYKNINQWNVSIEGIGKSEGNNYMHMVKITKKEKYFEEDLAKSTKSRKSQQKLLEHKKCIVVIARQHPAETVSSYICQQLIKILLEASPSWSEQNQYFNWFIIPMANPDGVIHGNSRTNLKGYDINRCWSKQTMNLSTQVQNIQKVISDLKQRYTISYIVDLHGHSKQFDSFAYFCENNDKNRIINYLMSKKCKYFNYYKSKYGIGHKKRQTFRGQMYYRQQIKNAITIQTSLFGYYDQQNNQMVPFGQKHFRELADALYKALTQYEQGRAKGKHSQRFWQKEKTMLMEIVEMQKQRLKLYKNDESQSNDSDSDPQDEYLLKNERIKVGIEVVNEDLKKDQKIYEMEKTKQGKQQHQQEKLEYFNYLEYRNIPKQSSEASQLELNRPSSMKFDKYNTLTSKNKMVKSNRRHIYTNSHIQLEQCKKITQMDRSELAQKISKTQTSRRKYSCDQQQQSLSRKKTEEIIRCREKQKLQIEKQKIKLKLKEGIQERLNKTKTKIRMRSQPFLSYPTAGNIRVHLEKIPKIPSKIQDEQNIIYYSGQKQVIENKLRKTSFQYKKAKKSPRKRRDNENIFKIICKSMGKNSTNSKKSPKRQLISQRNRDKAVEQNLNRTFLAFRDQKYSSQKKTLQKDIKF